MRTLNTLKRQRARLTADVERCERRAGLYLRHGNKESWRFWSEEAARIAAERDEVTAEHDELFALIDV